MCALDMKMKITVNTNTNMKMKMKMKIKLFVFTYVSDICQESQPSPLTLPLLLPFPICSLLQPISTPPSLILSHILYYITLTGAG